MKVLSLGLAICAALAVTSERTEAKGATICETGSGFADTGDDYNTDAPTATVSSSAGSDATQVAGSSSVAGSDAATPGSASSSTAGSDATQVGGSSSATSYDTPSTSQTDDSTTQGDSVGKDATSTQGDAASHVGGDTTSVSGDGSSSASTNGGAVPTKGYTNDANSKSKGDASSVDAADSAASVPNEGGVQDGSNVTGSSSKTGQQQVAGSSVNEASSGSNAEQHSTVDSGIGSGESTPTTTSPVNSTSVSASTDSAPTQASTAGSTFSTGASASSSGSFPTQSSSDVSGSSTDSSPQTSTVNSTSSTTDSTPTQASTAASASSTDSTPMQSSSDASASSTDSTPTQASTAASASSTDSTPMQSSSDASASSTDSTPTQASTAGSDSSTDSTPTLKSVSASGSSADSSSQISESSSSADSIPTQGSASASSAATTATPTTDSTSASLDASTASSRSTASSTSASAASSASASGSASYSSPSSFAKVTNLGVRVQGDMPAWDEEHQRFVSAYYDTFDEKYRAVLDTVNMASVEGALKYVQAECINASAIANCERKNDIKYVVFYQTIVAQPAAAMEYYVNATDEYKFAVERCPFMAMDGGQCDPNSDGSFPDVCNQYIGASGQPDLGFCVGGTLQDNEAIAPYPHNYWFSFPNSCPQELWDDKTDACREEYAGGMCPLGVEPDGVTCTFSYEILGYILLDDVVGITSMVNPLTGQTYADYYEFCEAGGIEFSVSIVTSLLGGLLDSIVSLVTGLDFWANPGDSDANAARVEKLVSAYDELVSANATTSDGGLMRALPTVDELAALNPPCYQNSPLCAEAEFGCKRSYRSQICQVCTSDDSGCEKQ